MQQVGETMNITREQIDELDRALPACVISNSPRNTVLSLIAEWRARNPDEREEYEDEDL